MDGLARQKVLSAKSEVLTSESLLLTQLLHMSHVADKC